MSLKDAIRAATLGAPTNFKSEVVEVNGEKITVRQMSVAERQHLSEESMRIEPVKGKGKGRGDDESEVVMDQLRYRVLAVIQSSYDEGGARVFDDADYDALIGQPCGGWVDDLADAALRLANLRGEAQKNSETTPADSGSSQ